MLLQRCECEPVRTKDRFNRPLPPKPMGARTAHLPLCHRGAPAAPPEGGTT